MEQPVATFNTISSAGSGGKLKKWRKKGEAGAIYNSAMYFTAHGQFGLNVSLHILLNEDFYHVLLVCASPVGQSECEGWK